MLMLGCSNTQMKLNCKVRLPTTATVSSHFCETPYLTALNLLRAIQIDVANPVAA